MPAVLSPVGHLTVPGADEADLLRAGFRRNRAHTVTTPVGTPADELQDYFGGAVYKSAETHRYLDASWLWAHLPTEIKAHILSFLPAADKVRCMQVSKELRGIVSDGSLWQTLDTSSFHLHIPQAQLLRLLHLAAPFVQNLNLRGCAQLRDTSSVHLTNLVNASFEGCRFFTADAFVRLLEGNARLRTLDLSGLMVVDDAVLATLCAHCPHIEALNISYCRKVSTGQLDRAIGSFSQLRDLRIAELRTRRSTMLALNALPSLTRLSISGCADVRDDWVRDLIYGGLEYGLTFPEAKARRPLVHLDISRCRGLTGACLRYMVGTLPSLQKLELAGLALSDADISSLAPFLGELTHIDLSDCPAAGDDALIALARHCSRLRHVQLSHCDAVTDTGVLALVDNLPLAHLECDNTAITNRVLSAVATRHTSAAPSTQTDGHYLPHDHILLGDGEELGWRSSGGQMRLSIYDCPHVTWTGVLSILTANSADPARMTRLKTFYGWQRPVDGHTKRLLRGEVAAAKEVERAWARHMMHGSEEALRSGGMERGTRLLDFDDESTMIIGRDRRRQSRNCSVM